MNFRNPNVGRRPRSTPARCRVAIAMSCASLRVAATHAESAEPLDASEVQAVVREIEAMVKTKEDRVVDFDVRDATPDRIERLYRSPEVVHLPKTIRENGLIFAGRGSTLLHFAQPSDVGREQRRGDADLPGSHQRTPRRRRAANEPSAP